MRSETDAGSVATCREVTANSSSTPFFSLVVPTIGRQTEVVALLESIDGASFRDFEVLIVDQNPDDRLLKVCETYARRFPLTRLKAGFRGAARARNFGATRARGTIVTFPDDDCELTPELLAQAKELFGAMQIKILVGMSTDRAGNPSATRFLTDERSLTPWTMWGRNIEFTMFFDRQLFVTAGGFDEQFGVGAEYGSDEGAELLIRLLRQLRPGEAYYSHRLRYYHPDKHSSLDESAIQRAFSYARGSGALLAKWPSMAVCWHSARLVGRAAIATIIFRGNKRRYYRARIRGFAEGFRSFRAGNRSREMS